MLLKLYSIMPFDCSFFTSIDEKLKHNSKRGLQKFRDSISKQQIRCKENKVMSLYAEILFSDFAQFININYNTFSQIAGIHMQKKMG